MEYIHDSLVSGNDNVDIMENDMNLSGSITNMNSLTVFESNNSCQSVDVLNINKNQESSSEYQENLNDMTNTYKWFIDKDFSFRLFKLQAEYMKNQYMLACLSTLGGKII